MLKKIIDLANKTNISCGATCTLKVRKVGGLTSYSKWGAENTFSQFTTLHNFQKSAGAEVPQPQYMYFPLHRSC